MLCLVTGCYFALNTAKSLIAYRTVIVVVSELFGCSDQVRPSSKRRKIYDGRVAVGWLLNFSEVFVSAEAM